MSGRAAVRGGSDVAVGDPLALDSNAKNFSTGFYGGGDDFKKAQRKGDRTTREGGYAVVGLGYTHIGDDDCALEVKGPNVGIGFSGSSDGARLMYKAEAASVSVSAGPVKSTVGLSADTGVDLSVTQLEAKVLGTGVSFGSGFEFELW